MNKGIEANTNVQSVLNMMAEEYESSSVAGQMATESLATYLSEGSSYIAEMICRVNKNKVVAEKDSEENKRSANPPIDAYIFSQDGKKLFINVDPFSVIDQGGASSSIDMRQNLLISLIDLIPFNDIEEVVVDCGSIFGMWCFIQYSLPTYRALERVKEFMGDKIKITVMVSPIADLMGHIFLAIADEIEITKPTIITALVEEASTVDLNMFVDAYKDLVKRANIMSDEEYDRFSKHEFVHVDISAAAERNPKIKIIE